MDNQIKNKNLQATQAMKDQLSKVEVSTFAKVRKSKTAPVQTVMDEELPHLIGTLYLLDGVDNQETTDSETGEVHTNVLYTVKVIQRKAKAKLGTLITIKVKDSKPIVDQDRLMENLLNNSAKDLIVKFTDIAHYSFIGGEAVNASSASLVKISIKEASDL